MEHNSLLKFANYKAFHEITNTAIMSSEAALGLSTFGLSLFFCMFLMQVSILKPTNDTDAFAWIDDVLSQAGRAGSVPERRGLRAEVRTRILRLHFPTVRCYCPMSHMAVRRWEAATVINSQAVARLYLFSTKSPSVMLEIGICGPQGTSSKQVSQ